MMQLAWLGMITQHSSSRHLHLWLKTLQVKFCSSECLYLGPKQAGVGYVDSTVGVGGVGHTGALPLVAV